MGYGVTFQYVHTMCCDQIVVIGISTAQTLNTSSRKQFKDNYMVKTENADTLKCYCERPQRNPVKGPKTHPPRRQFPWQGKEDRGKIRKGCHCHHLQLWRESDPGVTLDPITGGSLSLLISSSTSLFRTTDILLKSKISWVKIYPQGSWDTRCYLFRLWSPENELSLEGNYIKLVSIQLLWFSKPQKLRTKDHKTYRCVCKRNNSSG